MRPISIGPLTGGLLVSLQLLCASAAPEPGFAQDARSARTAAQAAAAESTPIRVLLFEAADSVTVFVRGVRREITRASSRAGTSSGVRADGGPVLPRWRADGAGEPLRVRNLAVRGALEIVPARDGKLLVVNEVPLDSYLAGTLGREMYDSWSPSALKAQAVASRTYALKQRNARRGEPWDLRSGTLSQVYAGVAAESESVLAAVRATSGEILVYQGEPILAAFHSSSGGRTASAEEVWGGPARYLQSIDVEDEWDSPDAYWRTDVSRTTLGAALASAHRKLGSVRKVEVLERTGSGRVARVRVTGERGTATVSGRELRDALGETTLKSTLFEVKPSNDGFVFVGSGNGHGVGLSQWGARAMAERGDSYEEILRVFYPGTTLRSMRDAPAHVSASRTAR